MEGYFYPSHNELDPSPGVAFCQRTFARDGLQAYIEIHLKLGPGFFVFARPRFLFGDSRPQIEYTYDASPLAVRVQYGAGYNISNGFSIRLTHSEWDNLGKYTGEKRQWNAVSLRYQW